MKYAKAKLKPEFLLLAGRLGLGGREIFYEEIDSLAVVGKNGGRSRFVQLRLKNEASVEVGPLASLPAENLKRQIDEIIAPQVLREENPCPVGEIEGQAAALMDSWGANMRKTLSFLLRQAVLHQVSDLVLEPEAGSLGLYFKKDGLLIRVAGLTPPLGERLVNCVKACSGLLTYRRDRVQEGRLTQDFPGGSQDLRVSVMPSERGERISVRFFQALTAKPRLEDLGFSGDILVHLGEVIKKPTGLFIFSGPAGAGKTTTLYALLQALRDHRGHLTSIVTLEDPVECRFEGLTQIQVDPRGELTFVGGVRACLRQDPGVIMIGEVRDRETAQAAIQAALTGHLVLTSLHAGSAVEAVIRYLELGGQPEFLASAVGGVLNQRLIRTVCPFCRDSEAGAGQTRGCPGCFHSGFSGRTVMAEYLPLDGDLKALISRGLKTEDLRQAAAERGLVSLGESAARLVSTQVTTREEVERVLGR